MLTPENLGRVYELGGGGRGLITEGGGYSQSIRIDSIRFDSIRFDSLFPIRMLSILTQIQVLTESNFDL